jgi:hypothetical protein
MVTEEELFTLCPPKRPLGAIPQFDVELRNLKDSREHAKPYQSLQDAADLRAFLEAQLETTDIVETTPFELLTRIHVSEGYSTERERTEVAGAEVKGKFVTTKGLFELGRVREVSKPFHTRDHDTFFVATPYVDAPIEPEQLSRQYLIAVRNARLELEKELAQQSATYTDMITINRRLIDKNIRCFQCRDSTKVVCVKYDWLEDKLL